MRATSSWGRLDAADRAAVTAAYAAGAEGPSGRALRLGRSGLTDRAAGPRAGHGAYPCGMTSQHLFIVTGASRGLGRAVAERLAGTPGHVVLGLSRQAPAAPAGIEQWAVDLADPLPVAERLAAWLGGLDAARFSSASLVNNAALLTPPAPLADTDLQLLSQATRVGLEAPLLLSAAFLRATRGWAGLRRVLHVSSGLGRRAMASSGTLLRRQGRARPSGPRPGAGRGPATPRRARVLAGARRDRHRHAGAAARRRRVGVPGTSPTSGR